MTPTQAARMSQIPRARSIDDLIDDEHIVVVTGSGGVGKTTMSAALALRAAERGRRVVVCTIDPARRLAQAMGLDELDNTPRRIAEPGRGELWALQLDMKRTFDDLILQLTTRERAEAIFANPFYAQIAGTLSGTQEYMAMAKLWELHEEGRFELIVVDTPPTRSALDFLDGPRRLTDFLEGRFLRMLLLPALRAGRRGISIVSLGTRAALKIVTKVTGATLLADVGEFLGQFEGMYDEFRERSHQVRLLLEGRHTRFVVVSSPTTPALREARFFIDRLTKERMPLGGIVVNRAHPVPVLEPPAGPALVAAARVYRDLRRLGDREEDLVARILADAPAPIWRVPDLIEPVIDLDGLHRLGALLADAAG